jgi:hypothetical protein
MDITITLNDDEQKAFAQLLDVALRHSGAGALDVAAHFKMKIAQALKEAGHDNTVDQNTAPTATRTVQPLHGRPNGQESGQHNREG